MRGVVVVEIGWRELRFHSAINHHMGSRPYQKKKYLVIADKGLREKGGKPPPLYIVFVHCVLWRNEWCLMRQQSLIVFGSRLISFGKPIEK